MTVHEEGRATARPEEPGNGVTANPGTQERDQAEALPQRLARYERAKVRAMAMGEYLYNLDGQDAGSAQRARKAALKLADCGNYLEFHHYFTVGEVRLGAACFCKQHLICPLCAIRRGSKALEAYLARWAVVKAQRPQLRPYLLTFTVANGPDLGERWAHLRDSWGRLTDRRRCWRKGKRGSPWTQLARVEGLVGAYEVTNRGNGWHPHLHAVALCEVPPDQKALRGEWEAITGDSFMVDVRPFRANQDDAEGFMEVLKYAMKFGDLTLEQNWHAAETFRGRRLLFSLGCFRGVKVPEKLTDEPLEDLPYIRLLYRYLPSVGYSLAVFDCDSHGAQPGAPRDSHADRERALEDGRRLGGRARARATRGGGKCETITATRGASPTKCEVDDG